MNAHTRPNNQSRFSLLFFAALLVIAPIAIVQSFQGTRTANDESAVATYSHGALHVTIPYHAPHAGAGLLTVEVLDPEDKVLGRAERRVNVDVGKGQWREDFKLASSLGLDDLVWHRLHYRFAYSDRKDAALQGTESISQILRMPVIHI